MNLFLNRGSKIAMISLSNLIVTISNKYGYELYLEEALDSSRKIPVIKFRIDSNLDTFHLELSRSWKTTRVDLIPGPFASKVATFLSMQVLAHKSEIINLFANSSFSLSEFSLEIDNHKFENIADLDENSHNINFYVEAMTSESSIEHGLLNDKEASLIELAASVIVTLLPRPSHSYSNPEEVIGFPEGASTQVLVNKYERDPRNRSAAISAHGFECLACGFDFKKIYGDLGADFIIVHHIVPVSKIGADYEIDPVKDLITLCANCHAMIHRQDPPLSLEELRSVVSRS